MMNVRGKEYLALCLVITTLLAALIMMKSNIDLRDEKLKKEIDFANNPNSLRVFVLNFIYHHISKSLVYSNKKLKRYMNDYVNKPDPTFDLFYVPRRKHYCQANYLYATLNFDNYFLHTNYIFMDYPNSHGLKKELSGYFDFLNTAIYKQKELNKKQISKLQNMEWNPKLKIFFTSANFNYNHKIGKTHLCMFQMSNHLPGTGVLHREDLLADKLKAFGLKKRRYPCFKTKRFYPKTYRLYKSKECKSFFSYIQTAKFKKDMKTKNVFVLKNVESHNEQIIDYIELLKLSKIYEKGSKCGELKNKYLVQEYIHNQLKYRNGRKFKLRVFMYIISSKPLVVLFHKGYVLLDRYDNYVPFNKAMISHEKLLSYLKKQKVMNEYEYERMLNRIKKIAARLNFIAQDSYIKDPRFFQTIALDFVIDEHFKPHLIGVKGSPEFTKKNAEIVKSVINLQTDIVNRRASKIINFILAQKHEIYAAISQENVPMKYVEDFISYLQKRFDVNQIRKQFDDINYNDVSGLLSEPGLQEFDLIYDGTKTDYRAYKSLISKYCLAN